MKTSYDINGRSVKLKQHNFEGKLSVEEYENQIYQALSNIGITKEYVEVIYGGDEGESYAQALWTINKQDFIFRCESQDKEVHNLGAIAQAIQEDIRQVTRGIKDLFTIMNQYKTQLKKIKKKNLFSYGDSTSENSTTAFPAEEIKIDAPVNEPLDPKYKYLERYPSDKLDVAYHKLKDQCILQNKPNHPMFIAMKIVRQKKGLTL